MKATHLRVDALNTPLGLGDPAPRFSWHCEGGVTQTAYQIRCFRKDECVWDSGRVESVAMTHIPYAGKPLRSRDRVAWQVSLWDENGQAGETAESVFELGLLEASDWKAQWISGDYTPEKGRRYPVDGFRKSFRAKGPVARARLYASARGVYDLTLNGQPVETFVLAPGSTDYRCRIQYQTYDLTALLSRENTLEMRLADGWFRGSSAAYGVVNVYGSQTSLIAQLELEYADGSRETIVSDGSWDWSNDGPIRFADLKDGEIVNAAMAFSYTGKAREVEGPTALLVASDNVPVTEHERLKPVLLRARDGVRVLDFGQNLAGRLAFRVHGAAGQRLRFVCGEVLDGDGHVDLSGIQESRPAKGWNSMNLVKKLLSNQVQGEIDPTPRQEVVFTCSGGEDAYKTAFALFGFR